MCPAWRLLRGSNKWANQKQDTLYDWLRVCICFSPVGPKLEIREKLGKLSVTNHILAIQGQLLQGQSFGFLGWSLCCSGLTSWAGYCRLWVRVQSLYMQSHGLSLCMNGQRSPAVWLWSTLQGQDLVEIWLFILQKVIQHFPAPLLQMVRVLFQKGYYENSEVKPPQLDSLIIVCSCPPPFL